MRARRTKETFGRSFNYSPPFKATMDGLLVVDCCGRVAAQFSQGASERIAVDGRDIGGAAEIVADALNAHCGAAAQAEGGAE